MWTKPQIYNHALQALLLQRQIIEPTTDKSNEAKVLNANWDLAFNSTLQDLNLDSTSDQMTLELVATKPNQLWEYAYRYPIKCLYLRRLIDADFAFHKDNRATHVAKQVRMFEGEKVIMTNLSFAQAEFVSKDLDITSLSAPAGAAVAYKLAYLSSPLITGKGSKTLREDIMGKYVIAKTEAQEHDVNENFMYHPEGVDSEFVFARTT